MQASIKQQLLADLNSLKAVLIDSGYTIVPSASYTTDDALYTTVYKDGKFLHISNERYIWSVYSVYQPSKEHGTGTKVGSSDTLSLELIDSCLPDGNKYLGANNDRVISPKFYRDVNHYMTVNKHWYKEHLERDESTIDDLDYVDFCPSDNT